MDIINLISFFFCTEYVMGEMIMGMERKNKKKSKVSKVLIVFAIIFGVLMLATGSYVYYLYWNMKETANKVTDKEQWKGSEKRSLNADLSKGDPVSILLMGVDQRESDAGRSDSLMMITLNPKTKSMVMFSIPRDSRTEIVGRGTIEKINHAYAYGGVKMQMQTVENFLNGIPIDYYVQVNMESFQQIVDAIGGVTVNNKIAFTSGKFNFPVGQVVLNGEKALSFTRMRKNDPRGDFGRTERQRLVVTAIIDQGAKVSNITKLTDVLKVLGDNVKTNLSFDEMNLLMSNYKECRLNTQTFEVKGAGKMIDNVWYYIVSDEERQNISTRLKDHLTINSPESNVVK